MDLNWYSKTVKDVISFLNSYETGLTKNEAQKRLETYGPNKLPESKVDSIFIIFFRQFQSPLIYILLLASLIVFFMGEFIDAFIILITLLFNSVVGTFQEGKAQNSLLALGKFTETNVKVLRDKEEIVIPDYEIIPGDVIVLQEGDKVPADARIIRSHNLTVSQSALTGESEPVHKQAEVIIKENLTTADQHNMLFKGTNIVAGNGEAIVVSTGIKTVIGKISKEISVIDTDMPLKTDIKYLTRFIISAVFAICTFLFFLGIFLGKNVSEMFSTVVSLAVSLVPEGLPIVITLVLATGVWRMSKRNALVKKLQAVEALGQAKVIAVDKTGTLTKNEVILQKIYVNNELFTVTGDGYKPTGDILLKEKKIDPIKHSDLVLAAKISAYGTNDGAIFNDELNEWEAIGDPTDCAISTFAQKMGFKKDDVLDQNKFRLSEIPFSYKYKYHITSNIIDNQIFVPIIGAPENLLAITDTIWQNGRKIKLTKDKKVEMEAIISDMSKEGLRVLGFGIIDQKIEKLEQSDVKNISFVGFYGLNDTLRPEVQVSIVQAQEAGIKIVMITGDHILTAEAIAKEAGIFKPGDSILTDDDINNLSEEELSSMLDNVSVFARITPDHKLKIVNAYKKRGITIAMTGDGVNDAPSLVAADLGIAMGKIGTEVAKEASDIILLDDNFKSIVSAIEEGRNIYNTIKKVIAYLFSTSFSETSLIAITLFLGLPLPILATQIVWLNLVTDGFLNAALAMEPKEDDLLKRKFVHPKKYFFDKLMIIRIFTISIPMTFSALFIFINFYQVDLTKAWTATLTVLAVSQWFNAWNCRHERKSIFSQNPFSNPFLIGATIIVIILQLGAIYNPILQTILRTTSLSMSDWLLIIPSAVFVIFFEEARKAIIRIID